MKKALPAVLIHGSIRKMTAPIAVLMSLLLSEEILFDVSCNQVEPISISALERKGFDKEVLDRVIVVEFGGEAPAFDAFHPEGYVIDGKYVPLSKLGRQHS